MGGGRIGVGAGVSVGCVAGDELGSTSIASLSDPLGVTNACEGEAAGAVLFSVSSSGSGSIIEEGICVDPPLPRPRPPLFGLLASPPRPVAFLGGILGEIWLGILV